MDEELNEGAGEGGLGGRLVGKDDTKICGEMEK